MVAAAKRTVLEERLDETLELAGQERAPLCNCCDG